eukprot:gene4976-34755_t
MLSASRDDASAFPPQLSGAKNTEAARIALLEKRITGQAPDKVAVGKHHQPECAHASDPSLGPSPGTSNDGEPALSKRRKVSDSVSPSEVGRDAGRGAELLVTIPEADDSSQAAEALCAQGSLSNQGGDENHPPAPAQTPVRNLFGGGATPKHQRTAPLSAGGKGPSPGAAHRGQTKLSTFYPQLDSCSRDSGGIDFRAAMATAAAANASAPASRPFHAGGVAPTEAKDRELSRLEEASRQQSKAMQERLEMLGLESSDLRQALDSTVQQLQELRQANEDHDSKMRSGMQGRCRCRTGAKQVKVQGTVQQLQELRQANEDHDSKMRSGMQGRCRCRTGAGQVKVQCTVHQLQELRQANEDYDSKMRSGMQGRCRTGAGQVKVQGSVHQLQELRQANEDHDSKMRSGMQGRASVGVGQQAARGERELQRMQVAAGAARLGTMGVLRTGPMQIHEVWEDGYAFQQLTSRQQALAAQREEIETARKALRKKMPLPPTSKPDATTPEISGRSNSSGGVTCMGADQPLTGLEFVTADEIFKIRLAALKQEEEEGLRQEEERLNTEKLRHLRLMKRLRDEDASRFDNMPLLVKRYQLTNLLGKGGFSEAFDLKENTHGLHHPHIVGLMDILEIDNNTFATVLDFCDGPDLESVLRENQTLPEKEARSILAQVFSGLVYMNQPGRRIIHYDLKPANILFDSLGQAKITDFGLSKIVEEGQTMGMELTSQGAGTYWYLPPECFEMSCGGMRGPRISNKMLYGKRPFGEGLSQEHIMRERVMLNAREFPTRPAVSVEAKEFIRRCLTYRQEARWDVLTAATDSYLALTKAKASRQRSAVVAAVDPLSGPQLGQVDKGVCWSQQRTLSGTQQGQGDNRVRWSQQWTTHLALTRAKCKRSVLVAAVDPICS